MCTAKHKQSDQSSPGHHTDPNVSAWPSRPKSSSRRTSSSPCCWSPRSTWRRRCLWAPWSRPRRPAGSGQCRTPAWWSGSPSTDTRRPDPRTCWGSRSTRRQSPWRRRVSECRSRGDGRESARHMGPLTRRLFPRTPTRQDRRWSPNRSRPLAAPVRLWWVASC